MNSLRRFSRHAWLLHGYLIASMILWPTPRAISYWTDTNGDGVKEFVENPPQGDSWWEDDSDADGLTNAEEVAFVSDPYNPDSDYDGLTDKDERDLTPSMLGYAASTNPWSWDSNGDGYSDYDTYFAWANGMTPSVNYFSYSTPSPVPQYYYWDLDGDGIGNVWDYYPDDSTQWEAPPVDTDGDEYSDSYDSHPTDSSLWEDWNYNGTNDSDETGDSDGDGYDNGIDSHPSDSSLWEDWNYNGINDSVETSDSDGDGYDDGSDSHPSDGTLWEDWNNNGTNDSNETGGTDSDYDGYDDTSDSHPYDILLWADWNYNGINDFAETWVPDSDYDGHDDAYDSNPNDSSLWDDWNYNGTNDFEEYDDDSDDDGVSDTDEQAAGTNPWFADSDGDGLNDGEERDATTNPLHVDTDGDGLTDFEEVFIYQTNPKLARTVATQPLTDYFTVNLADQDADGVPDLVESYYGRAPLDAADAGSNLDADGVTDLEAYQMGWSFRVSFAAYDQDGDGITDAREAFYGLNPNDPMDATDDHDHDGVLTVEEISLGLDPGDATTFGGPDLTYVNDSWNLGWRMPINRGSLGTSLDNDTDGDGMPDYWEHRHRLNLRDATDAIRDIDRDGLNNLNEFRFGTHPRIAKTNNTSIDSTRLYATGSPVNASGGGLMSRYRAQIAADLASGSPKSYFLTETKTAGSNAPPPVEMYYEKRLPDNPWSDVWSNYTQPVTVTSTWLSGEVIDIGTGEPGTEPEEKCIYPRPPPEFLYDEISVPAMNGAHCGGTCGVGSWSEQADETTEWVTAVWVSSCSCQVGMQQPNPSSEPPPAGPAVVKHESVRFKVSLPPGADDEERVFGIFSEDHGDTPIETFILGPHGSGATIAVRPSNFGYKAKGPVDEEHPSDSTSYRVEELTKSSPDITPLNFSASDSAGSRYRKIGLNGMPLTDSQPQVQDESGERREETYIDAFTRQLQHSVTDVYAQDASTLLPLSVRRDATPEAWNDRSGLKPMERPELPFGPGWRSNICSHVRFEISSDKIYGSATVVDEQGGTQRFVTADVRAVFAGVTPVFTAQAMPDWKHSTEELTNAKTMNDTLTGAINGNIVLTKKFGITCQYEAVGPLANSQSFPKDRLDGSADVSLYMYARLTSVTDRLGNQLIYEYSATPGSLVPVRIYDPDRPGRQITFQLNGDGRVLAARGPAGETVSYSYLDGGRLDRVTRGSSEVSYGYTVITEEDINFPKWGGKLTPIFHQWLTSITDELNRRYSFQYQFDHDTTYDTRNTEYGYTETHTQLGRPPLVARVILPDTRVVIVAGERNLHAGWPQFTPLTPNFSDMVQAPGSNTTVTGSAGQYRYVFSAPHVYVPAFVNYATTPVADPHSLNLTVTYTEMGISHAPAAPPASGPPLPPLSEYFVFNSSASFALASAKDASGNTTSFEYLSSLDDPSAEIDALGQRKEFTYGVFDIMTSSTDKRGVKTTYSLDTLGRKTSEIITNDDDEVLRTSTFEYSHPTFAGFMTRQTVDNEAVDTAPASITDFELGDPAEFGWWAEVTQTTLADAADPTSAVSTTTVNDLSGNKRSVIDARGLVTNFSYDQSLRLTRVDHPDGAFKRMSYDAHGNLVAAREGQGDGTGLEANDSVMSATFHAYDLFNRRTKTTLDLNGNNAADASYDPDALTYESTTGSPVYDGDIVTTTTYNDHGLPVDVTDARGLVTHHEYDGLGRRVSTTVNELTTSFFYDGVNNGGSVFDVSGIKPNRTIDPRHTQTMVVYDKLYRPVSSTVNYRTGFLKPPLPSQVDAETARDDAAAVLDAALADEALARTVASLAAKKALTPAALQELITAETTALAAATTLRTQRQTTQDVLDGAHSLAQGLEAAASSDLLMANGQLNSALMNADYDYTDPTVMTAQAAVTSAEAALTAAQQATAVAETAAEDGQIALDSAEAARSACQAKLDESNVALPIATAAVEDTELHTTLAEESEAAQASLSIATEQVTLARAEFNAAQQVVDDCEALLDGNYSPFAVATAVTLTAYNENGQPTRITDPLQRVTINEYDDLGQLVKVIEPDLTENTLDNPTVTTSYTHHGKPWQVTDQNNNTTTTTYDALGRAVMVASPLVQVTSSPSLQAQAISTVEYDAAGNAIASTDPLGRVTETVYDSRNRPTDVYAPTVWDANAIAFVRPHSHTDYDDLGQVAEVTDPMGAVTTNHYDRAGRVWKVEAAAVEVSSSTSQVSSSLRPTTITTFDPGGLALTVTNPLNQTVTNTYNALGQLVTTLDAEGIENEFEYDEAGNRTSVIDGLGQETIFAYDGLNRLVSQSFASVVEGVPGDTWTYQYNAVQKLSQTSPRGIVTSYTYDARDRLMTVSTQGGGVSDSPPVIDRAYNYDNAGRLLTVTEGTSADVSYTYDAMGRVTSESSRGRVDLTHSYEYDLAGNRIKASYSTGRVVETSYDGLNRPEVIAEGGRVTQYGYDLGGRAVILVAANGQTSQNGYDALGRLTDRTLFKTPAMTEAQVLAQFEWWHDALGNVTAQHETWPGAADRLPGIRSTTMGYDDNNRLTSEVITQPEVNGATPTTTTAYTYDDANNRATKTVTRTIAGEEPVSDEDTGHWTYTYNAANQLTNWAKYSEAGSQTTQKTATLTYDDAGNRTSQTVTDLSSPVSSLPSQTKPPAAKPGITNYTWDAQDRLASVTMPDGSVHRYEYDYRTRRIGTVEQTLLSADEKRTAIIFSGGLSVAEYEATVPLSSPISPLPSSSPTVEYTRGPDMGGGVGGMLYSQRSSPSSSTPTLRYSLSNGRGDIVAQADQSATLTWTASYEAYGKRTKETGQNLDKQRGNSKDEDPTGLLNEGFRYRDIETGVWLSRDPAGLVDGPNVYAYVKQNPWTAWDPDGLKTITDYENDIQKARERRDDALAKYKASGRNDNRALGNIHRSYNRAVDDAKKGITKIVMTARMMEHYNRSTGLAFTDNDIATFDDESRTFKDFNFNRNVFEFRPFSKTADHLEHGEWAKAGKAALAEAAVWAAFAGAGKLASVLARSGRLAANSAPIIKCFPRGTKVETPNGQVCIEDIQQGDLVLSQDAEGQVVAREVVQLVRNQTAHWVEIRVGGETIKATGSHPFWEASKGIWLHARDLKSGMSLKTAKGAFCQIETVTKVDLAVPEDTFNFEVAELHNYFAGTQQLTVLTHNTDPWEIAFSRDPSLISGSDTFAHGDWQGRTLNDAVAEARRLGRLPDGLAIEANWRVNYAYEPGEYFHSANNRTLWVAQEAGLADVAVSDTSRAFRGVEKHLRMPNGGTIFRLCPY